MLPRWETSYSIGCSLRSFIYATAGAEHPDLMVEQVAILYALHNGFFRGVSLSSVPLRQSIFVQSLRRKRPHVLREIAATQQLSEEAKAELQKALEETSAAFLPS